MAQQLVPLTLPALVVVIGALLVTAPVWGAGYPWGSDSWGHLQQAAYIGKTLRQYGLFEGLRQSAWMPDWYLGTPTYVYYPPLSPLVLGLLTALLNDAFSAYRVFVIAVFITLGLSVYLVGFRWSKNRLAAQIGALVALLAPYTLRTVFVEGNFSRALALLALPWLIWWTEQLLRDRSAHRLLPLLSGLWAVTIIAHVMQAAIFAVAIGVYILLRSVNNIYVPLRRGLLALLPITLGAGLAAAYLLPAYSQVELPGVPFLPYEKVAGFSISLAALLPFHADLEAVSIGIAALLVALLITFRTGKDFHMALVGAGLICVVLAFGPASGIFQLIPLNEQFLPERFLNVSAILFPLVIATIPAGAWSRSVSLAALAVILLVDGTSAWRSVFMRPAPADEQAIAQTLAVQPLPGRVVPLTFPDVTSADIYFTSVIGSRSNVSGWSLENTSQQNSVRRLLDSAQHAPDYLQRVLSLWNTDYVLARFADPQQSAALRTTLQFDSTAQHGDLALWQRAQPSAFAQQLTDHRVLVIGNNTTAWLYAFPTASEGYSPNPADYSADYLSHFSVIGLNRITGGGSLEPALGDWVRQGNTLIVDLSGLGQLYNQGVTLFGVRTAAMNLTGDYALNWPSALAGLPDQLTFGSLDTPWVGATYFNLDHTLATISVRGQSYPLLGYQDVGKGKAWFISFNLLYLLNQQDRQVIATRLSDYLLAQTDATRALTLPPADVTVTARQPAHVTLTYASPKAFSLVLSMTYFPRWQASLDGVPIVLHNHEHLILLDVPDGTHTITLDYVPLSTPIARLGLLVSLLCIALTFGVSCVLRRRPVLALGDRLNSFDDRLPQLPPTPQPATVSYAPCPNCGFRLARSGPPTNESYPFNALECPICGFSMGATAFIPGDSLTDFSKRRLAIAWLRSENIVRSQLQRQFGVSFEELFEVATPVSEVMRLLAQPDQPLSRTPDKAREQTTYADSIAFSPDGTLLASGSRDHLLRLWSVETGREIARLSGHTDALSAVAFAASGALLASGAADHSVRLWDVDQATKEYRQTLLLRGHVDMISSLAFSPDGRLLASASLDRTIRLWTIESGEQMFVLRDHQGSINTIAFSADGRLLVSASVDGTARIWDVSSGETVLNVSGDASNNAILTAGFNTASGTFITVSVNGLLNGWDLATGSVLSSTPFYDHPLRSATLSEDGSFVAVIGTAIRLLDTQSGDELVTLTAKDGMNRVVFSRDNTLLAAVDASGVQVWQLK